MPRSTPRRRLPSPAVGADRWSAPKRRRSSPPAAPDAPKAGSLQRDSIPAAGARASPFRADVARDGPARGRERRLARSLQMRRSVVSARRKTRDPNRLVRLAGNKTGPSPIQRDRSLNRSSFETIPIVREGNARRNSEEFAKVGGGSGKNPAAERYATSIALPRQSISSSAFAMVGSKWLPALRLISASVSSISHAGR